MEKVRLSKLMSVKLPQSSSIPANVEAMMTEFFYTNPFHEHRTAGGSYRPGRKGGYTRFFMEPDDDNQDAFCEVVVELEWDGDDGVTVNVIKTKGITLSACINRGYASEILELLTDTADKHGVDLSGEASPFAHKSLSKTKLVAFYRKHGFKTKRGKKFLMTRKARKTMARKNTGHARENPSFARVRRIMMGQVPSIRTVGIFTAQNPQATKLPPKWNKALNKKLMAWLRERGYGPIPIGGMYGMEEDSYLVPNITRKDTVEVGRIFNQESVIWASRQGTGREKRMVWQFIEGTRTAITRDVSLSGKDIQSRKDYYSIVRGRKFLIPFFDEKYSVSARRRAAAEKKRKAADRTLLAPPRPRVAAAARAEDSGTILATAETLAMENMGRARKNPAKVMWSDGTTGVYPDYPYYVFNTNTNRVISGWDYKEDAQFDLDEHKEMGEGRGLRVYARKTVMQKQARGNPVAWERIFTRTHTINGKDFGETRYVAHGYLNVEKDEDRGGWVAWVGKRRGRHKVKLLIGDYKTLKQAKAGALQFHKRRPNPITRSDAEILRHQAEHLVKYHQELNHVKGDLGAAAKRRLQSLYREAVQEMGGVASTRGAQKAKRRSFSALQKGRRANPPEGSFTLDDYPYRWDKYLGKPKVERHRDGTTTFTWGDPHYITVNHMPYRRLFKRDQSAIEAQGWEFSPSEMVYAVVRHGDAKEGKRAGYVNNMLFLGVTDNLGLAKAMAHERLTTPVSKRHRGLPEVQVIDEWEHTRENPTGYTGSAKANRAGKVMYRPVVRSADGTVKRPRYYLGEDSPAIRTSRAQIAAVGSAKLSLVGEPSAPARTRKKVTKKKSPKKAAPKKPTTKALHQVAKEMGVSSTALIRAIKKSRLKVEDPRAITRLTPAQVTKIKRLSVPKDTAQPAKRRTTAKKRTAKKASAPRAQQRPALDLQESVLFASESGSADIVEVAEREAVRTVGVGVRSRKRR